MRILNSKFLGQTYYKFTLGWGIISIPVSLIGYLTFVKVWQATFEFYRIPFILVLTVFPILLIAVGFSIGHMMIRHQVQAEINSLINRQANRELCMVLEKLDIIIKNQESK
jgi:hypothetical protein